MAESPAPPRSADRHPGHYSATLAFDRQRSFVLANAWSFAAILLVSLVCAAAIWRWMPGGPGVRGFLAGVFLTSIWGFAAHWVSIASGSSTASMGQAAEEWTATELRRLRRKGWRTVNHVTFRKWDIDHIAIGPDGVIVVETKWRADPLDLEDSDDFLEKAASRLYRNERDVAGHLGWGAKEDARITSVLVVWGPRIKQVGDEPLPSRHNVNVLAGEHLRRNLADLNETHLSSDQIDTIYNKLLAQARQRDEPGAATWPTLRDTANQWLLRASVGVAGTFVAALALNLGWWYFAAAAAMVIAGVVAMRQPAWRGPAIAWLIGSQLVTAALLVWIVAELVTG
jgi:hypothetical protein